MSKKVEEKKKVKEIKEIDEKAHLSLENISIIFSEFVKGYTSATPKKIKLMDAFSFYCFFITFLQIGYCLIVGNFPMNSFLAGVFTPLGSLILTVCLRFQIFKETKYMDITAERAIWEYLFCMLILFVVSVNFLG